ncbi:MAG: S9 family peptidase, partial [Burkholderiales bacterium]
MTHFPKRRLAFAAALTALASLLIACSTPPASTDATAATPESPPAATIAPNANLVAQGIPPIPASVAAQVAKYTDFRGHAFVDWHPLRREMLVSHLKAGASTPQLFRVAAPMAEPEQLTDTGDPVREASYEPRDGKYIVFAR